MKELRAEPKGYIDWHDWAKYMSRTHRQIRCGKCGLYKIWVPKNKGTLIISQTENEMSEANCSESGDKGANLTALLSAIAEAEIVMRKARQSLLELQHEYLTAVGFSIENDKTGSFICDYVYRCDDEIFIDVDHAMEFAFD